jgi:preprotein translocase subunit SecY
MQAFMQYIQDMVMNKSVRTKLLFTLAILALYRLFVYIPVPFVDITTWANSTIQG